MNQKNKEFICPNCGGKLPFSLKKQIRGNNCFCGFPQKNQRTQWFKVKNLFTFRLPFSALFKRDF